MRRKDREVLDPQKIKEIIDSTVVCRLGFKDGEEVYIVPLNFGYREENGLYTFYFHSAKEGRKVALAQKQPQVGFELDSHYELHLSDDPCGSSSGWWSIIGTGKLETVEDREEKIDGLSLLMEHAAGVKTRDFRGLDAVEVMKLTVEKLSAKIHA